jgi:tetratricopeptide (TPR) repeat protein
MDTEKRKHFQDIYASDQTTKDDFTPQVSADVLDERKRAVRRHQFASFVLGMLVLILSASLVYVVAREYIQIQTAEPAPISITRGFVPRYSLAAESQWVLDFTTDYGDPTWSGDGDRPFNVQWILKAAFNIILGRQAQSVGEHDVAAEHFEYALEIFPEIEGVKLPLGALYFQMNEFDKALTLLAEVPEAELTPEVLNNLGAACMKAKSYDRAEHYLLKALEVRPSYPEPQKNLAMVYKEMERDDEAIVAFERYINLRPMDIDTQHTLALYLTKLGRWQQAAMLLERLTSEITDVPVLYFLLAQVEMHNNRPQKAMEALQRGIQLSDPTAALAYMDSSEFELLRSSEDFQVMMQALEHPQD